MFNELSGSDCPMELKYRNYFLIGIILRDAAKIIRKKLFSLKVMMFLLLNDSASMNFVIQIRE